MKNNQLFFQEFSEYHTKNKIGENFIILFTFPHVLLNRGDVINLGTFVRKKKDAKAATLLWIACKIADKHGVDIHLEVCPLNVYSYFDKGNDTEAAKEKLEKYYSQFGFITSDKSTRTDFQTMKLVTDIHMIRLADLK